jgi:uncharacterized membrane protein YcaP (DUF421 family)
VTEGLILVLTVVTWEFVIDWLQYRFPALRPILAAPPLILIENGKLNEGNAAKEMLPEDELRANFARRK